MNKKFYEQPQINIVEVKRADIICTSTTTFGINDGEGFDEYTW